MPLYDNRAIKDHKCKCNRVFEEVHCIACGSLNIEGRVKSSCGYIPNAIEKQHDGRWWRCRRCKLVFCDRERYSVCEAPLFGASVKVTRTMDAISSLPVIDRNKIIGKKLGDPERLAELDKLFGTRFASKEIGEEHNDETKE
jgi:hypothetical protein